MTDAGGTVASREHLDALIGEFYDSALEPERWHDTMRHVAAAFEGNGAGLHHRDFRRPNWGLTTQVGFTDKQVLDYMEHYITVDRAFVAGRNIPAGGVLVDAMHITEREMDRDELYQDFLAPADKRYMACAVLANSDDRAAVLTILRAKRAGAFKDDERAQVTMLIPHLRRALLLQSAFAMAGARQRALAAALDHMPGGVMVLDREGKPVVINREAEALVARGDGLRSGPDGLSAARMGSTAALRRMIADALATDAASDGPLSLPLPRPSGKLPLIVWAAPVAAPLSLELALAGPHALLFVSDPEKRRATTLAPAVVELYGLTPAEARLLQALLDGATLESARAEFGVSLATVKTQLQAIFGKTGVNRQTDLIRLVLSVQFHRADP